MKIIKHITILVTLALCTAACNDWLDVKPKTEVDAKKLYERESGFKQVLTGAYISMCTPSMYGREMTFGMVDLLGGVYPGTGATYGYVRQYDYENTNVESVISNIWTVSYNTIANLNHMIFNLRKADRTMFEADNYNVILGEALGLRAYIHFDLLRLFSPSYKANKDALAIPYVTDYKFTATPHGSVAGVMEGILTDMTEAVALLKASDPIYTGREITPYDDDGYLLDRKFRLNYYAAKALMARICMWKGDETNAALCAGEVIGSDYFRWVTFDEVATASATERDRTFSPEHIFTLQCLPLETNYAGRLKRPGVNLSGSYSLLFSGDYLTSLFTVADDWRRIYLFVEEGVNGIDRSCTKLWQYEGMPTEFKYRLPLIRLPEMYLILAETMVDTDPDGAAELISTLMRNRGITGGIAAGSTPEEVRNAMVLEYRREFICEGVMFYYFKRIDSGTIDGSSAGYFSKEKYALPIPATETEFGARD